MRLLCPQHRFVALCAAFDVPSVKRFSCLMSPCCFIRDWTAPASSALIGRPIAISGSLLDRLRSVRNTSARLVSSQRSLCTTVFLHCDPTFTGRVPERITFRPGVLLFHCRNKKASYIPGRRLIWTTGHDSRMYLRTTSSHELVVRLSRLATVAGC